MSTLHLGTAAIITDSVIDFNNSELISNRIPSSDNNITNKIYVDSLISAQSSILDSILEGAGTGPTGITGPTGPAGLNTVGSFFATGNSNGLVITGNSIFLCPATNNTPGAVSTVTQTFGGRKTFGGSVGFSSQTINSSSGTQTIGGGFSYVLISNSSSFTLNMPDSSATDGYVLWIRKLASPNFTVTLNSSNSFFNLSNSSSNSFSMTSGIRTVKFYFANTDWYLLYSA